MKESGWANLGSTERARCATLMAMFMRESGLEMCATEKAHTFGPGIVQLVLCLLLIDP